MVKVKDIRVTVLEEDDNPVEFEMDNEGEITIRQRANPGASSIGGTVFGLTLEMLEGIVQTLKEERE